MPPTPKPAGERKKATNATIRRRIQEVLKLIIRGATRAQIIEYAEEKGWGLQERQISTYVERAREMIESEIKVERTYVVSLAIARYEALIQDAWEEKDFKTVNAALRELSRIQGNYTMPDTVQAIQVNYQGSEHGVSEDTLIAFAQLLQRISTALSGSQKQEFNQHIQALNRLLAPPPKNVADPYTVDEHGVVAFRDKIRPYSDVER